MGRLLDAGVSRAQGTSYPSSFSSEARCLCPTWKRMKMGWSWGILESGASETRSWRSGAPSPFRKLILVRSRTNDGCPSLEVSTQAKRVFPAHRSLAA